jgi:hypothetical protein
MRSQIAIQYTLNSAKKNNVGRLLASPTCATPAGVDSYGASMAFHLYSYTALSPCKAFQFCEEVAK